MQLILNIDDIGIKNMSSDQETNQIESKNKTESKDSNLSLSLSATIVESSQTNITDESNGIASCAEAFLEGKNSSGIGKSDLNNHNNLIPKREENDHDVNACKIKTETEDVLPCSDECQEEKSSVDNTTVSNCDENIDSDIILRTVKSKHLDKTEYQDENDLNINEKNGKCHLPNDEINQQSYEYDKMIEEAKADLADDANIKQKSFVLEKIGDKVETDTSPDESIVTPESPKCGKIQEEVEPCTPADAKIKKEACKYEKINNEVEAAHSADDAKNTQELRRLHENSEELKVDTSADNSDESGVEELPDHVENIKENQQDEESISNNNVTSSDENKKVKDNEVDDINAEITDNVISNNVENCIIEDSKTSQHGNEKTVRDHSSICSVSDEVIDIADEKDSVDDLENQEKNRKFKKIPTGSNAEEIEKLKKSKATKTETDQLQDRGLITIDEDIIDIADEKDSCDSIADNNQEESCILRRTLESNDDINSTKDTSSLVSEAQDSTFKKSNSRDRVSSYKLSNTLDILSDEEEEENSKTKSDTPKPNKESVIIVKQCINIEEDDDIMVIDDESSTKGEKIDSEEKKIDKEMALPQKCNEKNTKDALSHIKTNKEKDEKGNTNETRTEVIKSNRPKNTFPRTPLLSSNALKSFKKNLGEMTREELEDFCILTIAEAVFDRSNLGELKSQIKMLTQNFEEHKLKAKNLAKQNRDLQVVLKSIQEEQKKNSDAPITPLKITRSVGMQVLMTDKVSRKRQAMLSSQMLQNTTPTKQIAPIANKVQSKPATSPTNTKTPLRQTQQQIPVPRLVPAVNPVTKLSQNSSPQANSVKSPANVPNGIKTASSATKPEKRTHTKMQQSSAVTVDLTDDEPPAKVVTRNFNSPVRCVPPQTLLAARPTLPMTSPRKVYIPISGQQAQNIRPGQHIMLKSVTGIPGGPGRPRVPSPNVKNGPHTAGQIRPRIAHRHPAPLPELMKQYQPPNWKALPPAPELKLAKVENGIVISWKIDGYREENHEEIASYQLFAYQETSQPPNTSLWKKIGDVKALPLPMACTLTQFMSGYKYYFAVRAVDVKSRFGPFSLPGSILLLKN